MARVDGVLEVWDLLEASHQAIASIPVAAVGLTSVAVNVGAAAGAPGGRSLIAVGKLFPHQHLTACQLPLPMQL